MKRENNKFKKVKVSLLALFLTFFSTVASTQKFVGLIDQQLENRFQRSYQYVAMYDVIQKFVLEPASSAIFMDRFNKSVALTELDNHHVRTIALKLTKVLFYFIVII